MKTAMQQDQREREEAEPQMSTHPSLSSTESPEGEFLAKAKESREQHEGETDAAIDQA